MPSARDDVFFQTPRLAPLGVVIFIIALDALWAHILPYQVFSFSFLIGSLILWWATPAYVVLITPWRSWSLMATICVVCLAWPLTILVGNLIDSCKPSMSGPFFVAFVFVTFGALLAVQKVSVLLAIFGSFSIIAGVVWIMGEKLRWSLPWWIPVVVVLALPLVLIGSEHYWRANGVLPTSGSCGI